ncbi:hypothetical protein WJX81_001005 [Elliptochloris bilobata]|uniref:LMBR1-like membrane protein n=1 Tax=Elliptochloris bilobata TaxID=381761 RepID=A0AAW1QVA4_9CHLO
MFYYEADSDATILQRWLGAAVYEVVTAVCIGCILGVCYALVGYVEYPVCDAVNGKLGADIWKQRCSFPIYIIAMSATVGWVLFMVFAGVGLVALPLDLVRSFLGRPTAVIPKSEYIKRARGLGQRAITIKGVADALRIEERELGRGFKWRGAFRRVQEQLLVLEADCKALELVFPQGEDPDYTWVATVLMFYLRLACGVIGAVLSVCWLLQVVLYLFTYPPLSPFLNALFTRLDSAFPLFGTAAFAIFCFYLIGATIKGCMRMGLRLLVFTVHPMQPGATLMSSFLFNVALVLLATNAAIQFCAQAFALYANETAIHDIWGNQILSLMGIKYLYSLHVFLYSMFVFVFAALVWLLVAPAAKWKRLTKDEKLEAAYAT